MTTYQKRSVYILIAVLAIFLIISLITNRWAYFLWSLLPAFVLLMTAFFTKVGTESDKE